MDLVHAAHSPFFFVGIALGAGLLCLGTLLGVLIGRRLRAAAEPPPLEQMTEFMRGLAELTTDVAQQVDEYQQVVDGVAQRIGENAASRKDGTAGRGTWIGPLVEANRRLKQRLTEAEEALTEQSNELATYVSAARTDALTGLPNRRALDDEMRRRFAEWRRQGIPFAVVLADVDYFKKFNDQYGHLAGDQVLISVGRVLSGTMREADVVARFGGEEFAIILPGSGAAEASQVAERVRSAVERSCHVHEGQTLRVTVSCGVAHVTTEDTTESLIKRADAALYASKHAGRNFVHWHDGRKSVPVTGAAQRAASEPPSAPSAVAVRRAAPSLPQEDQEFPEIRQQLRQRLRQIIGPPPTA